MHMFCLIYFIWVLLSVSCFILLGYASCCPHQYFQQSSRQFVQKTERFWEFSEEANKWVEVELPYDLVSCINGDCGKVGLTLEKVNNGQENLKVENEIDGPKNGVEKKDINEITDMVLPQRKRISLTKLAETSIWVTGESGSIFERFWNGLEWVIAPHELPISAGHAISVFIINQTILALSESGYLFQMHVEFGESSLPVWIELTSVLGQNTDGDTEQNPLILVKSGVVSHDVKAYFCTKNGTLVELAGVSPTRWINHGQPAGANVAAIADATSTRGVVYTISSAGNLYEYDSKSKPSWKKHIWKEGTVQVSPLVPSKGCMLQGSSGDHSMSLFLLTEAGTLIERRLHQRKWKWIVHGSPQHQNLTSITPALQDESSETLILFFSTSTGSVFEYRIRKQLGTVQNDQLPEAWVNHLHPLHAKAAKGIPGLQLEVGRILFPLDDGRLAELHIQGVGGENSGPALSQSFRRKSSTNYMWSILEVPESEGWNAEYCTEERGPRNCMIGIKDELVDLDITSVTRRRKQSQTQNYYLSVGTSVGELTASSEECNLPDEWISSNFRLRLMFEGKSFFFISDGGLIFEYLCMENMWIWLKHESSTAMKGILGNYNGTLFMVDAYGSLLLRERSGNELAWKNCSAMRKGRRIIGGQPWDGIPSKARTVTAKDSLFFVSKNGRLMQFMVSMRKFKWKDCGKPPNTKVACIVDQGLFRENIVFVIGSNGRLYQYNKVTDLWHEHYQSQHLVLSQFPGTAIRPSLKSLTGSLFMLSREGGLVEYHWDALYEWNWVEHGTPYKGVTLVGSPGPCLGGNELFLIGSDGKVYLRYMEKKAWKWRDCGFPSMENKMLEEKRQGEKSVSVNEDSVSVLKNEEDNLGDHNFNCDPKVASTRPIPFSDGSVIFELRDGRLAEIQLTKDGEWVWSRIIGTPTSLCIEPYLTVVA
ncbi:hypothetical protein L6164_028429 [Bauhinia variegata]|uniref:Uncharacterized protein n=1 Tax=Bauhinia variegata TaxID=167791 RepID=A0ACB9L6P4_BAUVA|nr:hypothetical protein L6164_028429 [Bauhinia variegata]